MEQLTNSFSKIEIQHFLFHTQTLVALIDSCGNLQEWNPAFERIKELRPRAVSIQEFLLHPFRQVHFAEMLQEQSPQQATLEFNIDSKEVSFVCLLVPLKDKNFLFLAEPDQKALDTKLARLEHDLEIKKIDLESVLAQANEISHTDPLTFLPNRRKIVADLQRAVAGCNQNQRPLTVFMIDIDHFKKVNDTFGHLAGDRALQAIASRLQESIRREDKIGRYGGEEFIILLPGTDEKPATKLAERLLDIVREMVIPFDGKTIKVTVSLGIAQCRIGKESWEELLKRADNALYQSKQRGRNRWTISEIS
jgi:diguanylate cyclase (GGDEF)-like protein